MIDTNHPKDRHIQRAEVMAAQGARPHALLYLATLAQGQLRSADIARAEHRGDAQDRSGRAKRCEERAALYVQALAAIDPTALDGMRDERVMLLGVAYQAEHAVEPAALAGPTFSHPVRSPFWPMAKGQGIYVLCDDRTAQRRGFWLEMHLAPPDIGRTSFIVNRRIETREEAVRLAGVWVSLGFAVLAAEEALQAREGVTMAPAPPETPDGATP